MDLRRIMELIQQFLFLPPRRLLVCTFGFLAIMNAFVIRHSVDVILPQIHTVTIQKNPTNPPKILRKLRERLNFNPPVRFSYGDGTNRLKKPLPNPPGGNLSTDNWKSEHVQPLIMVSFYMGYVVTQMLGDLLAGRFGGKRILATALTLTAFLMLISAPLVSLGGLNGLIVISLMLGLAEGPVFPAFSCIMTEATTPEEKSLPELVLLSGGHIGIFLVNLVSGILLPFFKWSLAFYIFGACALVWFICFTVFCFNGLRCNPHTEQEEIHYPLQSIASPSGHLFQELPATSPYWQQLLTSPPTWSLLSATLQYDWAQSLIVTELRKLFEEFRDPDCWDNCCSCLKILLPFFLNWFVSILWGFFNEIFLNWNILTVSESRELATILASLASRICTDFTSCIVSNENKTITTVFNCMMDVTGSYYADIKMSSVESPTWISTSMAIAKEFGSLTNIIGPYINNLTSEEESIQNLRSFLWLIVSMFKPSDVEAFEEHKQIIKNT